MLPAITLFTAEKLSEWGLSVIIVKFNNITNEYVITIKIITIKYNKNTEIFINWFDLPWVILEAIFSL